MKVNGYRLKEAVRKWELRRETTQALFYDSLWKFEGQDSPNPTDLAKQIAEAENAIVKLQTAQLALNLQVKVEVHGKTLSLCEVVKSCGGADRIEQLWRTAAKPQVRGYGESAISRDKDKTYAQRAISPKEAVDNATKAAGYAAALKTAVSKGNGIEVEAELSAALFE
jgi:hypothetical protein